MKRYMHILFLASLTVLVSLILVLALKEQKVSTVSAMPREIETLSSILKKHSYFDNANIKEDEDEMSLTIDDEYKIYIQNSSYLMYIRNKKQEKTTCYVLDAISKNYGNSEGLSLKTCEMAISGIINTEGIDVGFSSDIKSVRIDSDKMFGLYNAINAHSLAELISIDEINYSIESKKLTITNITNRLDEDKKALTICGNVYLEDKEKTFIIKTYDSSKEELEEKDYSYDSEDKIYKNFCISFLEHVENVKYYSINLQ